MEKRATDLLTGIKRKKKKKKEEINIESGSPRFKFCCAYAPKIKFSPYYFE